MSLFPFYSVTFLLIPSTTIYIPLHVLVVDLNPVFRSSASFPASGCWVVCMYQLVCVRGCASSPAGMEAQIQVQERLDEFLFNIIRICCNLPCWSGGSSIMTSPRACRDLTKLYDVKRFLASIQCKHCLNDFILSCYIVEPAWSWLYMNPNNNKVDGVEIYSLLIQSVFPLHIIIANEGNLIVTLCKSRQFTIWVCLTKY